MAVVQRLRLSQSRQEPLRIVKALRFLNLVRNIGSYEHNFGSRTTAGLVAQLQPLVEPQVSHFRQVPLRTMVKLPHSWQLSPS